MSTRRWLAALGVAMVAAGGAWAARGLVLHPAQPANLGPVIARVDGRPIFLAQAKARVEGMASVHGDLTKTLGDQWPRRVMDSLVTDVIVQEEAERRGIILSDEEIDRALSEVTQGFAGPDGFGRWLADQGMDMAELQRRIRLQLLTSKVYMAITATTRVSHEEIQAYYRSHRADFSSGNRIPPLLEVRTSIQQQLERKEKERAFAGWLEERRGEADVVIVRDEWWRNV